MNQKDTPLVDELILALISARHELIRLQNEQGDKLDLDSSILDQAEAAVSRYDVERDRTDLDAATLPNRTVITLEGGCVTSVLTDAPGQTECVIIDYDVDEDWDGEGMVSIPQTGADAAMAQAFVILPHRMPVRVRELYAAVVRACSPSKATH